MESESVFNFGSEPGRRCCNEPQVYRHPGRRGLAGHRSGCPVLLCGVGAASGRASSRPADRWTQWNRGRRPVVESGSLRPRGLPILPLLLILILFTAIFTSSGCGWWRKPETRKEPEHSTSERQGQTTTSSAVQGGSQREVLKRVYDPWEIPDSLECYLRRAEELTRSNNFSGLARLMLEADSLYPNNTEILTNLGFSYLRLGELPRARFYLERAIQLSPNSARANNLLKEVDQRMDIAPTSIVIWVHVWDKRIVEHSLITEVRGGLEVEKTEKIDGRVHVLFRGKVRRELRYLLVIPYLPDGQHYLAARRQ